MRRAVSLFLLFLFLSACAVPAEADPKPPPQEVPAEDALEEVPSDETGEAEDRVLLTLEAPLAGGRTLTLEAFGRVSGEYDCGVQEVRVYDGEDLLQTVQAREGNMAFWGGGDLLPGETVSEYTSAVKPEGCMEVLDLNFDGNTDFGLFAFLPNNMPPYYYWMWDSELERYQYAFTLQGVEAHPGEGEISSEYKSGSAGSQRITEYYKPDGNGELYLDRVERETCDFEPERGWLDYDRGWAHETWVPPEAGNSIRPDDSSWTIEADLILVCRKFPVCEDNGNGTLSHFTEIWERKNGELQMTSREEFFYEDQL